MERAHQTAPGRFVCSSTVRAQSRLLCHGAYPAVCSGQGSSDLLTFLKLHDSGTAYSGHGEAFLMTCDDSERPQQPQLNSDRPQQPQQLNS